MVPRTRIGVRLIDDRIARPVDRIGDPPKPLPQIRAVLCYLGSGQGVATDFQSTNGGRHTWNTNEIGSQGRSNPTRGGKVLNPS